MQTHLIHPPIELDITKESIQLQSVGEYVRYVYSWIFNIRIAYLLGRENRLWMRLVFRTKEEKVRFGRGLAENTFRKHYHGLRTIRVHFQQQSVNF